MITTNNRIDKLILRAVDSPYLIAIDFESELCELCAFRDEPNGILIDRIEDDNYPIPIPHSQIYNRYYP